MNPPRIPLGKALVRDDGSRARAAQVTTRDISEARILFHDLAPDPFKGLIEARPTPDQKTKDNP